MTPNVMHNPEPASSTNRNYEQVDDITKDTNDLGDWLYDQFFKTIENQVINNTDDKNNILTRRSGSQLSIENPTKSKKWRKQRKPMKQKGNRDQLRRKLLRITENDSLFDISSKSSSDSSDSSSSSDVSSMEYEVQQKEHHKHDDGEHGHKKIVVINKKPKQPLPSFIFLPNLETPFYPPIGLPAPPIVPMYPIVPVPPVPLCPITGCDDNRGNGNIATISSAPTTTTTTSTATTAAAVSSNATTSEPTVTSVQSTSLTETSDTASTDAEPTIVNDSTSDIPKTDSKTLRSKNKKRKKVARLLNNEGRGTNHGMNNLNRIDRQKIMQYLKQKLPAASYFKPSWNKKIFAKKIISRNKNIENPNLDSNLFDNEYLNNEINPNPEQGDETFHDNVDFKYITELIHRTDLKNNSKALPPIEYNPMESIDTYQSPNINENRYSDYSVPYDDGRTINRPIYHKPDESYYASLGRQIATMIRSSDNPENVDKEGTRDNTKNDLYLNDSPTSFWERSVRSPLAIIKNKNKEYEYLKKSNEELLFDIENKVEIIASTAPTLTLLEIENIVNVMEAAKRDIQRNNKNIVKNSIISNKNLNIDLWPPKTQNSKNSYKKSNLPYSNKVKLEHKLSNLKINNNFPSVQLHSIQKIVAWNNGNLKQINQTNYNPSTSKSSIDDNNFKTTQTNYNLGNPNTINHSPARRIPFFQNTVKQTFSQKNPYILSHRKYFQDNYNYYVNQKEDLPHLPPVARIAMKPSYFPDISQFAYL
ncbi:uncharacterized protein LOC112049314 [Bicyclus anynana]|uniref:Uncharacterized protein LOC112049314 n=1 Tax=Bicyclus anynana TaxID=110368 RepID=A0ABM3LWX4_BICAN|nr:uncharacterized protein LOC112049314 [Bicyclus anynana]